MLVTHLVFVQDSSAYVIEVAGQVVDVQNGPYLKFEGDVSSPVYIYEQIPPSTVEESVNEPAPHVRKESIWTRLWNWIRSLL